MTMRKPKEKSVRRWKKWGKLAPIAYLIYGILAFGVAGLIMPQLNEASPMNFCSWLWAGIIWGILMTGIDFKAMNSYLDNEKNQS